MTVSVVIRCFNEERHIGRLLNDLRAQTVKELDVVIVDSGSTDRTVEIANSYGARLVHIRPQEFSFGRALNRGIEAATGDIIILASAHVYPVQENWIEALCTAFADERVAIVYGKQRGNSITKYSEHQVFQTWFPDTSNYDQRTPFCNNANAAIRRKLWEMAPYDEDLTGLEDIAWAKDALRNGFRVVYEASAAIVHIHDETWINVFNRYRREAVALYRIMPQQRLGLVSCASLLVRNVLADLFHAYHDRVLKQELGGIIRFRAMQFSGTYAGFRSHGEVTSDVKRQFYYPRPMARPAKDEPPAFTPHAAAGPVRKRGSE